MNKFYSVVYPWLRTLIRDSRGIDRFLIRSEWKISDVLLGYDLVLFIGGSKRVCGVGARIFFWHAQYLDGDSGSLSMAWALFGTLVIQIEIQVPIKAVYSLATSSWTCWTVWAARQKSLFFEFLVIGKGWLAIWGSVFDRSSVGVVGVLLVTVIRRNSYKTMVIFMGQSPSSSESRTSVYLVNNIFGASRRAQ